MNDKPRIQLESLAFPITAHRLGIGKLAYHIMTFNQYIGLTSSMNCLATLKFTSASNKAMRTSLRESDTLDSLIFPKPLRFLKTPCNFPDNDSNMLSN